MELIPVLISKEIEENDDLASMIVDSETVTDGDVLVVAQKIISKQEGRIVNLDSVHPSLLAEGISSQYQKDPRIVQLILDESKRIIRMQHGVIIVETHHGLICANAGIDESNVLPGYVTLLPKNSDESAKKLRHDIQKKLGINVAVVISDTFGRPFRMGQTNQAIGISGIDPIIDYEGTLDSYGKKLRVTAIACIDELAGAAELIMKKTSKCPVVIVRNFDYDDNEKSISELVRSDRDDLFK